MERLFEENEAHEDRDDIELPERAKPRRGRAGKRPLANKRQRSRTDADASVVSDGTIGVHLAYKAHVAVDDDPARVITAAVATAAEIVD